MESIILQLYEHLNANNSTTNGTNMKEESVTSHDRSEKPWKYIGYRGFCDFVASDNDFFILRRFSALTARLLLILQDELVELETQLSVLESRLSEKLAPDVHNGSFRQETQKTRLDLIREIDKKLRAYNELIIQHSDLRSRPRVPQKDVASLANWFHNNQNAILEEETDFINHRKDLFAMVPKMKTPLRRVLEQSSHFRLTRLWRKSPVLEDDNVHYASDVRIDQFITFTITGLGLAMLISPLWILAFVSDISRRLAVITAFVVVFLGIISFTTVARPFESLSASAASEKAELQKEISDW
ncbi:hypothetical protein EPUS_06935 [Endocarpon pusillum Z07020]|uniref:DUF6594 domain-containing protein n=1 Tax=Endocarpon pusillum (strain Z07020 / HMAS-L-300199) TaxID=1263415 RepID=U1HH25_ENDPU|nr:uncharacterized protein EPUS_06935 [Endocarpon pusillum Z07020]ERF68124.1 hypothetical protein EPUS_06935 [Endocarpon pusillum Z07020]